MPRDVAQSLFPEIQPDKNIGPLTGSVVTGDNTNLIDQARGYGYLNGAVVDVTYGKGAWWKRWRPDGLVVPPPGTDFTDLPYPDGSFSTVCLDPPYVDSGAITVAVGDFREAYGLDAGRGTTAVLHLIQGGLDEATRVSSRFVLLKCMDYVSGGRFRPMSYWLGEYAQTLGWHIWDEIVHAAGTGPGGHNITDQIRARRAHSKLLVFGHPDIYKTSKPVVGVENGQPTFTQG